MKQRWLKSCAALAFFHFILSFSTLTSSLEILDEMVDESVMIMSSSVDHQLLDVVQLRNIEQTLNNYPFLDVEPTNRTEIFERLFADMDAFFARAHERIDDLAAAAQQSCEQKCGSPPVHEIAPREMPVHPYWHATELLLNPALLTNLRNLSLPFNKSIYFKTERSAHFLNRPINISSSVVHTPTDVYYLSHEVMSVVHWTEDLDEVFADIYSRTPEITWQYFCTVNSGVMRMFPGTPWPRSFDNMADTYDCRQTHWYLKASSSPKDALIILDSSGSMKGTRTRISAFAAYSLLETFTSDDFVNIALLQDRLTFLEGLEQWSSNQTNASNGSNSTHIPNVLSRYSLIQATDANKKRLEDRVTATYNPKFIANFSNGLNEAHEFLTKWTSQTSGCNKLLMIVSDGLTDTYDALYQKFKSSGIRIFTLLVDLHKDWRNTTMEASCATKGAYIHIPTLSSTLRLPYEYIRVLSRPLSYSVWKGDVDHPSPVPPQKMTVWSSTHFTSFLGRNTIPTVLYNAGVDHNCHGLPEHYIAEQALVLTVAQPVFNGTNSSVEEVTMLGVAAIDIPIHAIKSLAPAWRVGWGAYIFLTDNNGFVSIHPQYSPIEKNASKPAYRDTELSDLEQAIDSDADHDTFSTQNVYNPLRHKILTNEDGQVSMDALFTDYSQKVKTTHRQYFYRSFPYNDFRFGVAFNERPLSDYHVMPTYELYESDMLKCLNESNARSTIFDIEELFYNCANKTALILDVDNGWKISLGSWECSQEYLDRVYADICATTFLENLEPQPLPAEWETPVQSRPQLRYLVTYTGLTRIMSVADSGMQQWETVDIIAENRTGLTHQVLELVPKLRHTDVTRLVIDQSDSSLFVAPRKIKNDSYLLTMSKVVLTKQNRSALYAIAGSIWAQADFIRSLFGNDFPIDCSGSTVQCFILDDSAVLLYSSHPNDTFGEQFSQLFAVLMQELVRHVYTRIDVSDHQRTCDARIPPPIWSAANRLVNIFSIVYRAIFGMLMTMVNLMWEFVRLSCHMLMNFGVEAQKRRRSGSPRAGAKEATITRRCTRMTTMFMLNKRFTGLEKGALENGTMWWAKKISGSNMVFVVVNGTIQRNATSETVATEEIMDDDATSGHEESAQAQAAQAQQEVSHTAFYRDKEVAMSAIEEKINTVRSRPSRQCFGDIHLEEEKLGCEVSDVASTISVSSILFVLSLSMSLALNYV